MRNTEFRLATTLGKKGSRGGEMGGEGMHKYI